LHAHFGYFAETLTDATSEWFDALNLAIYANMDAFYTDFIAVLLSKPKYLFSKPKEISGGDIKFLDKTKQKQTEQSTDFIRRVEAEGVRIKATAPDIRDTIL